ncbi:MAG: helix-turn-helix transcriptional regulator [Chloroflexota bacterium]
MGDRNFDQAVAKGAEAAARRFRDDVHRLRSDAGISVPRLAAAAKIGESYLYRILDGRAEPSDEVRARIAVALGADLSIRLFPTTGPLVRDRHQARIAETLLAVHHPRWQPFGEVRVTRPSRGWIDLAFHESRERLLVATEIQSEINRLEELIRWADEKARSLPSWDGWPMLGEPPAISRLLVVRRTRATRAVVAQFARQLRLAYPAHPDDAIEALTAAQAPWPGPAMVWAEVTAASAQLVGGR